MKNIISKSMKWSFEGKALVLFSLIFVVVIAGAWTYAMKLRETVTTNNAVINIDPNALIEVERIRNIAESQLASARSFFLLGSKALFDKQKQDKETLAESLAAFERKYNLPQIPEIIKKITAAKQTEQEIFDHAMEFREKQEESKIVGQFYQSKIASVRNSINENLDEMIKLHKAELERARANARSAALGVETQIPKGMAWLTGLFALLFLGVSILIVRMLDERKRQTAERNRLFTETQKAVQSRDEVIAAISQDFKEPLSTIGMTADAMARSEKSLTDGVSMIKSEISEIENRIHDICDQKSADMGSLTLRLDQIGVDEILDQARLMLQPVAKQKDIRLQIESANPPILAFFDRERIVRVLANLIGNAIKFSPKHSTILVKVRSDQQFAHVSVSDSGAGIPEKQLTGIFDHFWQARKTAMQGAGIGLAVSKTIIEAHGGTIKVDSFAGKGSTFTFSLPRRRPVGAQFKRSAPMRATTRSEMQESSVH
ncbi:MAG: sensor histidine kinase [Pseudobdellovibrionaceae bacterium]